jgi:predicted transcriptional regulator of viral defense system
MVYVQSLTKFNSFIDNGLEYNNIITNTLSQVELIRGVRVSSLERTIVDSISVIDKYIDLEELLKCIELVTYIDIDKITKYLNEINKKILFKKVGYVLSFFNNKLKIDESFFNLCIEKSKGILGEYLSPNKKRNYKYISKWNLYAYEDLLSILSKGEDNSV